MHPSSFWDKILKRQKPKIAFLGSNHSINSLNSGNCQNKFYNQKLIDCSEYRYSKTGQDSDVDVCHLLLNFKNTNLIEGVLEQSYISFETNVPMKFLKVGVRTDADRNFANTDSQAVNQQTLIIKGNSRSGDLVTLGDWISNPGVPDSKPLHAETVVRRYSVKKVLLEISQNSQENTCARDSCWKVAGLVLFSSIRTEY